MLPEGATGPDNIFRGLDGLENVSAHLLIATGDMPFLTPEAVRDFLALCPTGFGTLHSDRRAHRL